MVNKEKQKYAVVDLEATSAGSQAAIIQVGIVIIEGDRITKTYSTDVNPHETLDEHIVQLTGISDEQLSLAPDFGEVAAQIFELIEDCIFVAHNVTFDANLLAEQLFLEGYELRTPRMDTVELAQLLYPTYDKYNLAYLAEVLGLDLSQAHTAIADAYATAQLFLRLQQKAQSLPKEVLGQLLVLADNLLFESRMLLDEAYKKAHYLDNPDYKICHGLVLYRPHQSLTPKVLSEDFALNMAQLSLEARPLQSMVADAITKQLTTQAPTFIEAQAGIGKTYAYLLALLASRLDEQLIISVPTKILQDQLMAKELQSILDVFGIEAISLKGPRNYIKLDAFYQSLQEVSDNRLINRFKMHLLVWLTETRTGDLDEIKQKHRFESYFDRLRHDGQLASSSLFSEFDFWFSQYEKAKYAPLLVTNHAYFLERVQDDKAFARGKYLVFDEAQTLVSRLDQFSRQRLDMTSLLEDLSKLSKTCQDVLQKRILESLIFELSYLVEHYHKTKISEIAIEHVKNIRELIAESSAPLDALRALFDERYSSFWFSCDNLEDKRVVVLQAATSELLHFPSFLPETKKCYFISATLSISQEVSLADLLGFSEAELICFSKEKLAQQKLFIDETMPDVPRGKDEEYITAIAQRLKSLLALGHPILVLFTNKATMLEVSEMLEVWEIKHLTQDKNGPSQNVKQRFDKGESLLLLATGAFWEGVDFVSADRMIEVITRLPFDNPSDAFSKKITEYLTKQGKEAFSAYFLPAMLLRLRQAIGRTMRRTTQRSAVLVLDKRIVTKSYAPFVLEALEKDYEISCQNFDKSLVEIEKFLL
ncbi:bifunctional DnaQ family exonuclease/ATP-dependent helicase [Streptococcus sp. zg-JUN1979]|uniref:bifunctional DnaQ family exonuclease/ATP-dependent helicase n=1 Tax=Streptococcus sp. zg-JUN1979 TaxID=3391450 RepID=UPI0039A55204